MADINERLQDRYKALANRKKMAKDLGKEIEAISVKLQNGAKFSDHRDRLQQLALDKGECRYWIDQVQTQIGELQEEEQTANGSN